jgi:NADH:ubiquinone oxidoreductase subunit 3 (subunit A)
VKFRETYHSVAVMFMTLELLMKGIFIASSDFETKRMTSFGAFLLFMAQLKMI